MKTITILLLLLLITSCLHKSEILKQEQAVVIAKQYNAATEGTAQGIGLNSSGNMTISTHYISTEESFNVVFKCEHNVIFTIKRPEIYSRFQIGDTVIIDYYELLNKDDIVKDFDFIDANPK